VVAAIDGNERGKATIRILGLNRRELMDARWRAQSQALDGLEGRVGQLMSSEDALAERADTYMGRKAPFSRAVYDWFTERVRLVSERALTAAQATQSSP
jgi:hypothetical protein